MNSTHLRHEKKTYILFYKPYGVHSQFTDSSGRRTLSDFGPFPSDIYSVGRLDADSEGLLRRTNDGQTKHLLLEPRFAHFRTYWAQVERNLTDEELSTLRTGVIIEGKKTRECTVNRLDFEPPLPPRDVPIRFRKNVPTAWIEISLTEGRNRQVRRMTAAVGHPTLRLIRIRLGTLELGDLKPGEHRLLTQPEIHTLLLSVGQAKAS
jgi:23S rRNA pseudouridine2457 synthase